MTPENGHSQSEPTSFFQREVRAYLRPSALPHPIPGLLAVSCVLLTLFIDAGITRVIRGEVTPPAAIATEPAPVDVVSPDNSRLLLSRTISLPIDIAVVLFLLWYCGYSPVVSLGLRASEIPRSLVYGICLAVIWMPIIVAVNVMARVLFKPDHSHPAFELFHSGDLYLVLMAGFAAVILAPVAEELLCRGLLQSSLSASIGPWPAILLIGILFGLAHITGWPDPIPLSVLGVALGLAMGRTQSLWTPIFFHSFFNGTMLLVSLIVD